MDALQMIPPSSKDNISSPYSTVFKSNSSIIVLQAKEGEIHILESTETLYRIPATIWDERRFVWRIWSLSCSALAFLLLLSLADGRLAIIKRSATHNEVLGYWTNCQHHTCPNLGKVTVSKHLGMGFMILALATETFCLFFMAFSFRPIFRRINPCDLVFSILNYTTGPLCLWPYRSPGVLISLSMLLFTYECWTLDLGKVIYVVPYYLCWLSALIQFLSGSVCLYNHHYTLRVNSLPSKSATSNELQSATSSYITSAMKNVRMGRRRTTFQLTHHPMET